MEVIDRLLCKEMDEDIVNADSKFYPNKLKEAKQKLRESERKLAAILKKNIEIQERRRTMADAANKAVTGDIADLKPYGFGVVSAARRVLRSESADAAKKLDLLTILTNANDMAYTVTESAVMNRDQLQGEVTNYNRIIGMRGRNIKNGKHLLRQLLSVFELELVKAGEYEKLHSEQTHIKKTDNSYRDHRRKLCSILKKIITNSKMTVAKVNRRLLSYQK